MKLVVLGAGGGLGRAFLDLLPRHHDITAFSHEELDVGDHAVVMQRIPPLKPDAVLNFAAMTNVDDCERDPDRAYRGNGVGPQNLALAARACDAMLLHVSTDYVFDGEKGAPYDELDTPNPQSVYGRSKLAGEDFVRALVPEHFVVRTAFVFGSGTDYCSGAIRRLAAGEKAGGIADRTGSPTYVRHLAARVLPLLLTGRFGTYHLAGSEATTWFEVLRRAKAIGGLGGDVFEQRVDDLGLAAPRPVNSSLANLFAGELGLPPMPPLDDALREMLAAQG